jgi:arylsulfatase
MRIDQRDPTPATVLRAQGYRTAQIGKNHLGDLNRHLPTVRGFDTLLWQSLSSEHRR